jgi:hypothetical protein
LIGAFCFRVEVASFLFVEGDECFGGVLESSVEFVEECFFDTCLCGSRFGIRWGWWFCH